MTVGKIDCVLKHLHSLLAAENAVQITDRQLLERFATNRDEAAFAALVSRHGAMVLNVCRRVLSSEPDAEDACQATFLVLACKARSIRKKDSVGSWLHGVAYRAATNLRRAKLRRRTHEMQGAVTELAKVSGDVTWREVQTILDEEIQRLPENLKAPILLCYLEGKTHNEAAIELGWSLTTFRGRLDRGRESLRKQLTRRGVTLSAVLLPTLLPGQTSAALPATLVVSIVKAATAGTEALQSLLPNQTLTLAQGVIEAMSWKKMKTAVTALVLVLLMGGISGLTLAVLAADIPPLPPESNAQAPGTKETEKKQAPAKEVQPAKGKADQVAKAPITVTMQAKLYEVEDTFYQKLSKAKFLSTEDLEKMERLYLDPPKEKPLAPPAGEDLFQLLDKQKPVLIGKEVTVVNGKEADLLSWHKVTHCLPSPDQVRKGDKSLQKIQEGVSIRTGVQVTFDRRFVKVKFTEKSAELEGIDKLKVIVDNTGKEVVAEVPYLKEAVHAKVRIIPDGGSFLLPLQYRPQVAREKDRWFILSFTSRIIIAEEEELIQKGKQTNH